MVVSSMSAEEFMKQQYATLREEIREGKSRIFRLLVLGTLLLPAAGFVANEFSSTFASASIPFVILVLMLAFVAEQNAIIRAGRYLKENIEPHIPGLTGWECWLEGNRQLRDMDRYFFGSFLLVFFIFYGVGSGMAVENLAIHWPEHYWYATVGYLVGGLWFMMVLGKHWHSCTTTTE